MGRVSVCTMSLDMSDFSGAWAEACILYILAMPKPELLETFPNPYAGSRVRDPHGVP